MSNLNLNRLTGWWHRRQRLPLQSFLEVLQEEQAEISGKPGGADLGALYQQINAAQRSALCLTGGGIRSAAFAFGVIQRFASISVKPRAATPNPSSMAPDVKPMLCEFDYLSTVSGGGYIGSWLSTWLYRARLQTGAGKKWRVIDRLNERTDGRETPTIENLRQHALYLAPRFSALSPDVWNNIACIIRNLLLNWFVIVPAIAVVALVTEIVIAWLVATPAGNGASPWPYLIVASLGLLASLTYTAQHLPTRGLRRTGKIAFLFVDLALWIIASIPLLCAVSLSGLDDPGSVLIPLPNILTIVFLPVALRALEHSTAALLICAAGLGAVFYFGAWSLGWTLHKRSIETVTRSFHAQAAAPTTVSTGDSDPPPPPRVTEDPKQFRTRRGWVISGMVTGLMFAVTLMLSRLLPGAITLRPFLLLTFGVPCLIIARLIGEVVFAALSSEATGADVNFEWLSRSGAYFLLAGLGWMVWLAIPCLGLMGLKDTLDDPKGFYAFFGVTGSMGLISALIGKSSATGPVATVVSKARQYLSLRQLASLGAFIFALALVLGIERLFDVQLFDSGFGRHRFAAIDFGWLWVIAAALAAFALAASWVVDVNKFSLHGLYRNRLVRTFLGASRSEEEREITRDRFTDYDGNDNVLIRQIWSSRDPLDQKDVFEQEHPQAVNEGDWQPFHIVNVTANFAASKNLAWQERKAASFTISPLHAGCGADSLHEGGAYLSTRHHQQAHSYGGPLGLTLGTAMAISGAAVNPNMGYYTSAGVSFLMTLFNVRLGWWLANPASQTVKYWATSPTHSLVPLTKEMFGLTTENSDWLLLTDGGHFDNTGLYEMIRRRCPIIVIVDGGADPDFTFSDLGRTLTKIAIDFGVRIDFAGFDLLKKRFAERPTPATAAPYWAVGSIRYRNDENPKLDDGVILYIKAGLHGTEPLGVLSYGLSNAGFPHDTTLNQFFQESQFEAYRALGYEIVNQLLTKAGVVAPGSTRQIDTSKSLRDIIEALKIMAPAEKRVPFAWREVG